jgi:hypothetical protein
MVREDRNNAASCSGTAERSGPALIDRREVEASSALGLPPAQQLLGPCRKLEPQHTHCGERRLPVLPSTVNDKARSCRCARLTLVTGEFRVATSRTSFAPGQSGNPAGRPKTRHAALLALDAIAAAEVEDVMRSVLAAAKTGDVGAAGLVLKRLWPERKGRPVQIDLPAIVAPGDIVAALGAVADAVAAGELSPEEGAAVAGILEAQRRAVETVEMEARIAALEQNRGAQ